MRCSGSAPPPDRVRSPAQSRLGEIYLTGLEPPATASASAIARLEAPGSKDSLLNRLYPKGLAVRRDPEQAQCGMRPRQGRMPTRRRARLPVRQRYGCQP